ncbi:MAG: hypothetical protein ACOVRK_14590 [Chryseobacterium taeanense]
MVFLVSCQSERKEELISLFSGTKGKKWNYYSIDGQHDFYPYRVYEFFPNGDEYQYINVRSTGKLEKIPKDNLYNSEKWYVINDSIVSIESQKNLSTDYFIKQNRKILYKSQDTIILQATKKEEYKGIIILTRYKR